MFELTDFFQNSTGELQARRLTGVDKFLVRCVINVSIFVAFPASESISK